MLGLTRETEETGWSGPAASLMHSAPGLLHLGKNTCSENLARPGFKSLLCNC